MERKNEQALEALLKRSGVENITTEDISLLAESLVSTSPKSTRSLAFLNLSKLSQAQTSSGSNVKLVNSVQSYLDSVFSTSNDNVDCYIPFVSLLTALFALSPQLAIPLLTARIPAEGSAGGEQGPDVLDVLLEASELPSLLQPALAELLAQVASSKQGREIAQRADAWLRGAIDYDQKGDLGVLCAVALSKMSPADSSDAIEQPADTKTIEEIGLAKKMMEHVQSSPSSSPTLLPTLEGLSILSTKGHVKHLLATSPAFLSSLLALSPVPDTRPSSLPVTPQASVDIDEKIFEPVETSLCYGLTTILVNITLRKPVLSAEDEQIAKLRAMAVSGKKGATVEGSPFDADEAVEERVTATIKAGVVPALRGLVRAESLLVREGLGRLCLNLVVEKSHRPVFVRDGGFKVLSMVVRDLLAPSTTNESKGPDASTIDYLPAVQALAKLIITTPPHLLFPPPHDTTALNALTPVYNLLAHPSSSLLQTFEALMALTNLATINPDIADRIVGATVSPPVHDTMWRGSGREDTIRVMTRVEELLLDSNTLVRRAATELVCNLIASPNGRSYFAGDAGSNDISARVRSRLNILLVLSSIDDTPTRLAAGGALAMLTEDPMACRSLLSVTDETHSRSVWTRLLGLLEPEVPQLDEDGEEMPVISSAQPNADLIHRAVIVVYNLVDYAASLDKDGVVKGKGYLEEAQKAGVEEKLVEVVKANMSRREILEPAVEALKILKRRPA
jgi:hypothetical protein